MGHRNLLVTQIYPRAKSQTSALTTRQRSPQSGFVLTDQPAVIRPGRKLVLRVYKRLEGVNWLIGEITMAADSVCQSVNRVFPLTLTLRRGYRSPCECPGTFIPLIAFIVSSVFSLLHRRPATSALIAILSGRVHEEKVHV